MINGNLIAIAIEAMINGNLIA